MKNIIEFPTTGDEQSNEPTHYIYEICVIKPDGSTEAIKCEGYLIATPAFIGICQGPYQASEFLFISPMHQVVYANSQGPAKFTGKLQS